MILNTDHLGRCLKTLENSIMLTLDLKKEYLAMLKQGKRI